MKKLALLLLIILISVLQSVAQLQDSKWKNVMYIPDRHETILHFKKDSAVLTVAADGSVAESMFYKVNKDTLVITKIAGTSPCSDETGYYKIELKDKKLFITPLKDACGDRANAFVSDPWIKQE